jgi:S-adenosylmethionine:tRNA ribosyltransferase-isomerase
MDYSQIYIEDYSYPLPEDSIAQYTLADRDRSRLLVVKGDDISESQFFRIADLLPENSLLVLNNTRVLHSRLIFHKETGAHIEVFCLEPLFPSREIKHALGAPSGCEWRCMVGNAKKWKKGALSLNIDFIERPFSLYANKVSGDEGTCTIRFTWDHPDLVWSQVMESCGRVPLPPYIKREPGESDNLRYQTIYARNDGSVAAPTAGLHFTDEVLRSFEVKNIKRAELTLHVGEGTFKPVTASSVAGHVMHNEKIIIHRSEIEKMLDPAFNIVSVGTTSMRTLESLYWLGVKTLMNIALPDNPLLRQWEPYQDNLLQNVSVRGSMESLLDYMTKKNIDVMTAETELIIVPGYKIRMVDMLITNFHQPRSTLLLLVAAFAGPIWRKAYDYALDNNFRFLSYGDACLFYRKDL